MRDLKKFLVGSRAFFSSIPEFAQCNADMDYLILMDHCPFIQRSESYAGKCFFYMKRLSKDKLIDHLLKTAIPRKVCMVLCPEVATELDFTIDDLKQLAPVFDKVDSKHTYLKVIYDAYISNNSFTLTDEQREAAFLEYKKARNLVK